MALRAAPASIPPCRSRSGPRAIPGSGPRPRPGSRPRPALAFAFLIKPDPPPTKLGPIQLVQSIFHVASRSKLSNSLATAALVAVCVGHLSCLPHEVLEILPRCGRGKIFDHNSVASPGARGPTTAPPSVAIAIVPAIASSVLNSDPAAVKVFPIQVLDGVISVPPIVKLGKAESLLHRDVPDPAVALQEFLYIPFSRVVGEVSQIDLSLRHSSSLAWVSCRSESSNK